MSRRSVFLIAPCVLLAAASLSCSRSSSVAPLSSATATASIPSVLAGDDPGLSAESLETAYPTNAAADDRASQQVVDAEQILKNALIRAAAEDKRLLVHLGSPG